MATAVWKKYARKKLVYYADCSKVRQAIEDRTRKAIDNLRTHFVQSQTAQPQASDFFRGAEFALNELKSELKL